ncbi:MAG: site-specific integrase [Gallionellaceae bacterium]
MLFERKGSPYWWASYTDANGKRARRSTGTTDKKEAEAIASKWKLEAHQGKFWDAEPTRTFDELILKYLKSVAGEKKSASRDASIVKQLKPFFTGMELGTLKRSDVRAYIDKRKGEGRAAATINLEIGLFCAAINYARREWDWNIPNNVQGMLQKTPEGRVRSLTKAEAQRLIQEAEKHTRSPLLAYFIRLACNTGCRKGELLGLEWSRVDLKENLFILEGSNTKNGKRRSIPLNAEARAALLGLARYRAENCPDSPWVFVHPNGERLQSVNTAYKWLLKHVGIKDFRIHDLRHTCASWLVSAGVQLPAVRDLLGHSTIRMTERYAHLSPENVRAAVNVLDGVAQTCHTDFNVAVLGNT